MTKRSKILQQILTGENDGNILFQDLRHLMTRLGFEERIRGSHHIFTKPGIEEIVNLQPKGHLAKIYQVKQVRGLILKYRLGEQDGE